ncbi:SET domain-containing protein 9 [Ciona intestinalis]
MSRIKQIIQRWNAYKYRFLPWLALNLNRGDIISITENKLTTDENILEQLQVLFSALEKNQGAGLNPNHVVENICGFQIAQQSSSIKEAGTGVFVSKGTVSKGQVVALYPGTVYLPADSKFFQSLGNQFMFKCSDNLYIDGKDSGISKSVFTSCSNRDRIGFLEACDISWIKGNFACPLNVGQYVNNHNKSNPANVQYQEFDFAQDFPRNLYRFIPNINFDCTAQLNFVRSVALIATRDIHSGEELLSSYFTISR